MPKQLWQRLYVLCFCILIRSLENLGILIFLTTKCLRPTWRMRGKARSSHPKGNLVRWGDPGILHIEPQSAQGLIQVAEALLTPPGRKPGPGKMRHKSLNGSGRVTLKFNDACEHTLRMRHITKPHVCSLLTSET